MIHPIRLYGDPVLRRPAAPVDHVDEGIRRLASDMIETMHAANGVGLAGPQIGVPRRLFVAAELAEPAPETADAETAEAGAVDAGTSDAGAAEVAGATTVAREADAGGAVGRAASDTEFRGDGDGSDGDGSDGDARHGGARHGGEGARDEGAGTEGAGEDRASDEADDEADDDVIVDVHVMINPVIVQRSGVRVAPDGCLSVPGLWIDDMVRDAEIVVRYQDLAGEHRERSASGHFAHVIQHELDHLDGVLYFDRLAPDARRAFLETHRSELAELQRRAKALLKELRGSGATAS